MTLAELSLKRPVTAVMFFVSLLVVGAIAAFRLPLEGLPDVQFPFMMVDLPYAGSTPAEVERTITRPVEDALSTLTGIEHMSSLSRADGAQIFLQLKWGEDTAVKAVQAREKIDAIRSELPSDLQRYQVMKFATTDQPMLQLRISGDHDLSNSYDLLERKLKRPLERLPGVARVQIQGVAPPEVQIEISVDRLTAAGVSLNDLYKKLSNANFSASAGLVRDGNVRYQVRPLGEWRSLDEIRATPVNDKGLKLGDIAQITLKPSRLNYRRHLDGRPAIAVDISKERNANLVDVASRVLAQIDRVSRDPEMQGIQLYFLGNDAKAVTDSLTELGEAGGIGILLSVFVLYFFLRDWPSTLMVSLAIPVCLVITLGCMYFLGMTLNILSLLGLLLAVGMLVDNAVVAVESIYQYREKYPGKPWYSAVQGTQVVGIAIAAGTFTSIVVFLPNIFGAKNQISIFLTQIAIAMSIAHLASWLVAVSLVPMLSAKLPPPHFIGRDTLITRLQRTYASAVAWTLSHRKMTVWALIALFALSFVPITRAKTDMFPPGQSGELHLQYNLNGVYRLGELEKSIDRVEGWLIAHRTQLHIKNVYSYFDEQGQAMTNVLLTDDTAGRGNSQAIMEKIRTGLPKVPIGSIGFDQQSQNPDTNVQVFLNGDSGATLRELSAAAIKTLQQVPGLRDVRTAQNGGDRELAVHVDRVRARTYGFSANEIAQYVAIALRGLPLNEFHDNGTQIPVWLRFGGGDTRSLADLSDYKLRAADGTMIPLLSMVDLKNRDADSAIERENRQTSLALQANLAPGTTLDDVKPKLEAAMNALRLPPGYRWSYGQNFDFANEAGQQMLFNTLIALVLVYVVMCAMFESLIYPAAILTTFVFSILGVYWLFWLTGTTFSIMASIGVLILMGVVVNNGIVMIVHINQLRHAGLTRNEALIQGARDRLRPILMTMGTAILGMVPLCMSDATIGGGDTPYYPMARAIAGGLVFSTLVTLAALPVIYALLDDARLATRRVLRDARTRAFPRLRTRET
ncbi:MAG: efflux RND transporter permease subunit [Rudaea sp.]